MAKNQILDFFRNWIFPIISCIIVACFIEYFFTIRPETAKIFSDVKEMSTDIKEMKNKMDIIESRYTKSDDEGKPCKIGISRDKTGATVYVYTSENFYLNFKSGDVININNPYDVYRPSIWCTVCILEDKQKVSISDAEMFLSKEALNKLGINHFAGGVFNMSYKTRKDDLQLTP